MKYIFSNVSIVLLISLHLIGCTFTSKTNKVDEPSKKKIASDTINNAPLQDKSASNKLANEKPTIIVDTIKQIKKLETMVRKKTPNYSYINYCNKQKRKVKHLNTNSIKDLLFTAIHYDMPTLWDGTTWDFNGMARHAGSGEIACGYYVTTILKDLGFPIRRIFLAQQASAILVDKLCVNSKTFNSIPKLIESINNAEDSTIYIVGLDFHVGYITKGKRDEIYFIHSNYIDRKGVTKELASQSEALHHSNIFVLGNLSNNDSLMTRWINAN